MPQRHGSFRGHSRQLLQLHALVLLLVLQAIEVGPQLPQLQLQLLVAADFHTGRNTDSPGGEWGTEKKMEEINKPSLIS